MYLLSAPLGVSHTPDIL